MLKTIYKDFPKSSASRLFTPWSGYCFLLEKTAHFQLGVLVVVTLPLQIKLFQCTERDFEGIEFYKRGFNLEMFHFFVLYQGFFQNTTYYFLKSISHCLFFIIIRWSYFIRERSLLWPSRLQPGDWSIAEHLWSCRASGSSTGSSTMFGNNAPNLEIALISNASL